LPIIQITPLNRVIFEEFSYSGNFGSQGFNSVEKVRI